VDLWDITQEERRHHGGVNRLRWSSIADLRAEKMFLQGEPMQAEAVRVELVDGTWMEVTVEVAAGWKDGSILTELVQLVRQARARLRPLARQAPAAPLNCARARARGRRTCCTTRTWTRSRSGGTAASPAATACSRCSEPSRGA